MKIGFTGTSRGMTAKQRKRLYGYLSGVSGCCEFHHGDCIGADAQASTLADLLGYLIIVHPPINERARAFVFHDEARPAKEYLDRNHDIVDESTEILATPTEFQEQLRSGTWATIRYARKRHKPLTIIWPDGSIRRENHVEGKQLSAFAARP